MTRRSDISCRRGEHEFAILLPETRESGATVLDRRDSAKRRRARSGRRQPTNHGRATSSGMPESRSRRSRRASRRRSAAPARRGRTGFAPPRPVPRPDDGRRTRRTGSAAETADALRQDVLEAVAREILDARPFGRSLAVVALDVDGLEELSEARPRVGGRGARPASRSDSRRASAADGPPPGRKRVRPRPLGGDRGRRRALLGSLHATGDVDELPAIQLTAGITELVERDGAQTALGRAEHALWQAKQAGRGTIVVAVPGRRTPRLE